MRVETAICTWNRACVLERTLESLTHVRIPRDVEWCILVVNNNCTDATDEVIARHSEILPIERLFEPRPGLSNARNCAVAAAQGDLLIWTDDDVRPGSGWLLEYVEAAEQAPDATFFGGPILPQFDGPLPGWVEAALPQLNGVFGRLLQGDDSFMIDERNLHQLPYGANYAIRTNIQRQHVYDPELGLKHGVRRNGEESALLAELVHCGHHGRWVPTACIRHRIPAEALTERYIRDYYAASARANVRVQADWVARRSWLWAGAITAEVMRHWYTLTGWPAEATRQLIRASELWGLRAEERRRQVDTNAQSRPA